MPLVVDIEDLKTLFCARHDSEYGWDLKFLEKKCDKYDCEFCFGRPIKLTKKYCENCARKEGCISFQARLLKDDSLIYSNQGKDLLSSNEEVNGVQSPSSDSQNTGSGKC